MPEAVAAAVVNFFQLTGTAAAVANAAVQVAVYAATASVTRNASKEKQQGGLIDLQLNSAAPRQLVIGKRMTGGLLVDWYLAGSNNTKLYLPVYLSEGPCGQVTRVFAGGREVWSTPLVHGVRTTIPDFRSGGDRLWLTYYDGRVGQSADSVLVGLGQGWTSANKMTGCAWVLIECQWDSDNMRSPPSLTFEMEGAKLYDRRKDTTAGGSGSHRIDDPATWEWSDNPAVALDHFMLGRYWDGAKTFGIGLTSDEVPYDRFAAQANVCDEDVDKKAGGTQKRYRANGFIFASDDYAATVTKLCTAMAARPADFGGRFGVVGIESRTPVLTIDDGDLIADAPEVYTPKRSWSALVGAVEGRYQDPAQLYQPVDYPRVTDAAWEAEDGGEPKVATLDLEFEIDVERAQRLATLKARAERRQATLKGVYPLWTIELERGDWFIRTGAKWGEGGKTFEVIERILNPETYTVSIVAQEVDAADSAWDETTAQDGPPAPIASTDTLSDVEVPAITVSAITLAGTAASLPALKVVWDAPTDPRVRFIYIEVENVDGVTPKTVKTILLPADTDETVFQDGIVDGDSYAISAKFLTDTIPSDWCVAEIQAASGTYAVGTAASVPWSGVTGAGRPADNATVGARSGTNLYRTDGVTVLTQAEVRTAEGTASAITGQGALATLSSLAYGGAYLTGFAALAAKATIDSSALVGAGVIVYTALSSTAVRLGTNITRNDGATSLTDALAVTSLGTAAAIASQGALATLSQVNLGASGRVYRDDGATRLTDALAVTALGTAAAIASQGGLATLSFVTISTNLRLADGTTVATTAMVVTSAGTAAAIASQGSQATANHQRGASYSGTPTEGSWWADTTNSVLKLYTGGAWQTVASISSGGGPTASASNLAPTNTSPGGGSKTTPSTTISTSGMTSPTFEWEMIGYIAGPITIDSPTSATTTFTATGLSTDFSDFFREGVARCTIRDSSTGQTVFVDVTPHLENSTAS